MSIPVLSIRQPWAWLIVQGLKDVENRDWPTKFRGRIWIHAGKGMTRAEYEACQIFVGGFSNIRLPLAAQLPRGGIVGSARLVDCVADSKSEWFCGDYGFVLRDRWALPFVEMKGALGFFAAPPEIEKILTGMMASRP